MFRKHLIALVGIGLMTPALAGAQTSLPDPATRYVTEIQPLGLVSGLQLSGIRDRLTARFSPDVVQISIVKDRLMLRFPESTLFDGPGDHVSPEGVDVLTRMVEDLLETPHISAHVIGHYHDEGDPFASQISSQRRAMSVVSVLDSRTLPRDRISVTGMGASYPLEPNLTAESRALNRRVEIMLRSTR